MLNPPPLPAMDDDEQIVEYVGYDFGLSRRDLLQTLGAGLLISVTAGSALAQGGDRRDEGGRRGGGSGGGRLSARLHISPSGEITVMTGKVEAGQGARAEITQAAAEELRVPPERITLVMAATAVVPDDGITAGSRTTPSTLPAVRRACATARTLLIEHAARIWNADAGRLEVRDGHARRPGADETLGYADLAGEGATGALDKPVAPDAAVMPVEQWSVMGRGIARPNARDLVTGAHRFPSDIVRPGMLYGKVLRPSGYGAKLKALDEGVIADLPDVRVVRDGDFVGVIGPSTFAATQAVEKLAAAATWEAGQHVSSRELYAHLRRTAEGGEPRGPFGEPPSGGRRLNATYHVAYVQHAPMEPRAAVAEWHEGRLRVWTATQNPFGVRSELARAFHLPPERVEVTVPDFGGGFGGKHTGECAVEAARLAREAQRPVCLRWTRQEEFTWASFRPAAVIDLEATLDRDGRIATWYCVNINSGRSALDTPYRVGESRVEHRSADAPLRHGSYRALAATANTFARECFMDELAHALGRDPLALRLDHLENERLRAVLEKATAEFGWTERVRRREPNIGVGLACGVEKGSYVAACAEIAITGEPAGDEVPEFKVQHVVQAYECGAIINPDNLMSQVKGAIIMGLGPALREAIVFEDGRIQNATFRQYRVPRFRDVPRLDVHLINRPDLPSVGGGETPIIAIAPAIGNALFHATGRRVREMPLRKTSA